MLNVRAFVAAEPSVQKCHDRSALHDRTEQRPRALAFAVDEQFEGVAKAAQVQVADFLEKRHDFTLVKAVLGK